MNRHLTCAVALASAALTLVVVSAPLHAAPIAYQESVSGDLSATGAPLTTFTFDVGSNTISGQTFRAGTSGEFFDIDSFAFIVPSGMEVTSATVSANVVPGNPPSVPDIFWFVRRGSANSSTGTFVENFIASTGASGGPHTTLSSVPLLPNTYNVTGDFGSTTGNATYTFTFTVAAVPEPASLALLGLGSLALLPRARGQRDEGRGQKGKTRQT